MKIQKGLNEQIIRSISEQKQEPSWMLERRLHALKTFESMPLPTWSADLSELTLDDLYYYLKPVEKKKTTWDEVPSEIRQTFEKLGIPQHEREFFAGVGAQYESEMVYHKLKEEWKKQGIIFLDTDTGLKEHPELFKQFFGSVVPYADNKFAHNSAQKKQGRESSTNTQQCGCNRPEYFRDSLFNSRYLYQASFYMPVAVL